MDRFSTHQSVHFTIIPNNISFRNPKENINVVLLQNQQWDRMITDLKPQYFNGRAIEYRYEFHHNLKVEMNIFILTQKIFVLLPPTLATLIELLYTNHT